MKETITIVRDDLDGSEGAKSYSFGWKNDQYEIDLSEKNAKELEDFLSKYIAVAAKATARVLRERGASSANKSSNKEYLAKVRSWAAENGVQISARGRIAQSVIDDYEKANS